MMADNTTETEQKFCQGLYPFSSSSISESRVLRELLNDVGVGSERFSEIGTDGQRLPSDQWN